MFFTSHLLQLIKKDAKIYQSAVWWETSREAVGSIPSHSMSLVLIARQGPQRSTVHPQSVSAWGNRESTGLLDVSVNWTVQTLLSDGNCLSPGGVVFGIWLRLKVVLFSLKVTASEVTDECWMWFWGLFVPRGCLAVMSCHFHYTQHWQARTVWH